MRVVGKGSKKIWNEPGVGSGDAAALLGCAADENDNVLVLWARIVSRRELKEISRVRKVQELEQGSPDWLNWRKAGVGGSEVGCVVGSNTYKGSQALDVWGRKLPSDHPQAQPEVTDNKWMRQGREREPFAREKYEQLMGWEAPALCALHDYHDHVRVSLDGWCEQQKVVLEIKCSGLKNHMKYVAIGRIDDPFERQTAFTRDFCAYRYQVLYQLLITGGRMAHFVAYSPDASDPADQFTTFSLYREEQEMERLLVRVNEFWDFVQRREAPPTSWLIPTWRWPDRDDLKVPEGGTCG